MQIYSGILIRPSFWFGLVSAFRQQPAWVPAWSMQSSQPPKGLRWAIVGLLSFILVVGSASRALGQFSDLSKMGQGSSVPKGVSRLGEYEVTWVKSPIDDQQLFEIASPTIFDRSNPPKGRIPVEIRAKAIEERLDRELLRLAETRKSGTSQPSTVEIATLNNRPLLLVTNPQKSRGLKLVTVTEPDAEYHSETLQTLAEQWRAILQKEVNRQADLLNPQVLFPRIGQAFLILLAMLITTAVIWGLRRLIRLRQRALQPQRQSQIPGAQVAISDIPAVPPEDASPEDRPNGAIASNRAGFWGRLQSPLHFQRQLELYSFLQWLTFWLLVVIWYFGTYAILSRIPILMKYSGWALAAPLQLLFIWFSLSLTIRICKWLVDWSMNALQSSAYLMSLGETQRQSLRISTVTTALQGLITFIFLAIGVVWTLDLLDIPTSSILAGGAILGLAVSLSSQNLIKDLVNGCLILAEDQFAVGDFVDLGDASGMVETMNLRITQLRNSDGELITVPNSAIIKVRNLTRSWSRVNFSIDVAYQTDPEKALSVMQEVAQKLYDDPEWQNKIVAEPTVLGIDSVSHSGMTITTWIQTEPGEQWAVGREFRLRVRRALEENGIEIGMPRQAYALESSSTEANDQRKGLTEDAIAQE
jgi:moderate conductance mechanosensitive channel